MTLVPIVSPVTLSHYPPSSVSMKALPLAERPRERLRRHGPQTLTAVELMAILLGSGAEGRSALDVSRDLFAACQGSLKRLGTRPLESLTAIRGIGPTRAILIHAALELGRRMMAESVEEGVPLAGARDIYNIYAPRIADLPYEEFHVGILDGKHRLEDDVLVSRGIVNSALAHPREVFRRAIAENACAVVLVHNHPSGDPTPSFDDLTITAQLVSAGKVLGITVVDHVIVGRGRFSSFAEQGILV